MASWGERVNINLMIAILAFGLSSVSFYRSYFYTKQQLEVTVTEVSYLTNQGELYMTVAFSNGGNRDAALLRVEPVLWSSRNKQNYDWQSIVGKVDPNIPPAVPKLPEVVRAGGVEVVTLSAKLDPADAEQPNAAAGGAAFLGIRVATMNSDGNLYLIQHPVAQLHLDKEGRIQSADPAIHRSLSGFQALEQAPPGDTIQRNEKTPFVWAERQY